ncbi:MAG: amidohydrolase family protein [Pseudomonadota bacterium]
MQPIIDAHHHIWQPRGDSHPWLMPDAAEPFRYGDPTPIKRDYLPENHDRDASDFNIIGHVTMEAEWNDADPVAETRWTATQFERRPDYLAHVARTILHRDDVAEVLAAHARWDRTRAIRHKPTAASRPDLIEAGTPGAMTDPEWRRGFARLPAHGLHYELQAPWWHVTELEELAAAHPDVPIVINHMFMPGTRDAAILAGWRAAITRAAAIPQTTIKISGMGIAGRPWQLDDHVGLIHHAIDAFTPARCMIASNFPVDGLVGSFATIMGGYLDAIADLTTAEQTAICCATAERVYRLGDTHAADAPTPGRAS